MSKKHFVQETASTDNPRQETESRNEWKFNIERYLILNFIFVQITFVSN